MKDRYETFCLLGILSCELKTFIRASRLKWEGFVKYMSFKPGATEVWSLQRNTNFEW